MTLHLCSMCLSTTYLYLRYKCISAPIQRKVYSSQKKERKTKWVVKHISELVIMPWNCASFCLRSRPRGPKPSVLGKSRLVGFTIVSCKFQSFLVQILSGRLMRISYDMVRWWHRGFMLSRELSWFWNKQAPKTGNNTARLYIAYGSMYCHTSNNIIIIDEHKLLYFRQWAGTV